VRCALPQEARIQVHVRPRASRDELLGMREGVLVARVSAPPVDGRANDSLCKLIARAAGVARSRVTVIRGERSRDKLVSVHGLAPEALDAALRRDRQRAGPRRRPAPAPRARPGS
jgi:uncharacterized protein